MVEKMGPSKAIKRFLESGENGRETTLQEIKALKDSVTPAEWLEFARSAAKSLGVELDLSTEASPKAPAAPAA